MALSPMRMTLSGQTFLHKFVPCEFIRRALPAVLAPRDFDMARTAERAKSVHVVGILSGLLPQRHDVIAFETAGLPAQDAAVTVAAEHLATHPEPPSGVETLRT